MAPTEKTPTYIRFLFIIAAPTKVDLHSIYHEFQIYVNKNLYSHIVMDKYINHSGLGICQIFRPAAHEYQMTIDAGLCASSLGPVDSMGLDKAGAGRHKARLLGPGGGRAAT